MIREKLNFFALPFAVVWFLTLAFLAAVGFAAASGILNPGWLILPLTVFVLVAYDTFQNKHAIRKNYPLIGRLRYLFESIRPEIRQYFFEGELDGKPFSRRQRSIVYQRAKNEKQTISFGMQDDPNRIGYEWAAHSIYPKVANPDGFRVLVGNKNCLQPYSANVLNIGAMSYGALSKTAIAALNKGAQLGKFAHNTGEGGISDYHLQGGDLIWQMGTGYFGCRDDNGFFSAKLFSEKANLAQVKMIEVKLSQGAKPGHGGLLPSHKNTPEIARIRNIEPYTTVHSPSAHTTFINEYELLVFLQRLRKLSNGKPVGFKLCIGQKEEFREIIRQMAFIEIYPDFITIDGAEGGTGAAPLEFIDYMGMALADALAFANTTLKEFGIRQHIKLIASGKTITAFDMAKNIALGADLIYSARGMMFSLGCIQALQCDSGKCPVGIATQQRSLYKGIDVDDKCHRVASFHKNTLRALAEFIGACGFENLAQISADSFYRRTTHNENESYDDIYFKKKSRNDILYSTNNLN